MARTKNVPQMRYTSVKPTLDLRHALVALPETCPPGSLKAMRQLLKTVGQSEDALRPAGEIQIADLKRHPVIALGHMGTNPILERLYQLRLCVLDAEYPGPGGYAVTTAPNAEPRSPSTLTYVDI